MSTPDKSFSDCLDTALELEGSALESWLADLEREEPGMARRIRAALAKRETPEFQAFLAETSLRGGMGSANPESPPSGLTPGQRVGPYELERLLGAGGMAEVWLAKRADGAFKREVALKLPMVSRLRKDLEERFARERDILASLEHPHIARLYDGGVDAQRLPFLAMEYVPGVALTSWCDAKRLGVAERLRLLNRVLGAVHYAHERRVIHRDIKPSNILVNEAGEVRLLDFGVAKLLEDTEGAQLTRQYGRALTPDYASPEQLRGEVLDPRSDVYSVGVLLYELLTGKHPYALKAGASVGSLEQALATLEMRCATMRTRPSSGSTEPGASAISAFRICSTTPSSCATRPIRASQPSAARWGSPCRGPAAQLNRPPPTAHRAAPARRAPRASARGAARWSRAPSRISA